MQGTDSSTRALAVFEAPDGIQLARLLDLVRRQRWGSAFEGDLDRLEWGMMAHRENRQAPVVDERERERERERESERERARGQKGSERPEVEARGGEFEAGYR
jgi:hypothetical protein